MYLSFEGLFEHAKIGQYKCDLSKKDVAVNFPDLFFNDLLEFLNLVNSLNFVST